MAFDITTDKFQDLSVQKIAPIDADLCGDDDHRTVSRSRSYTFEFKITEKTKELLAELMEETGSDGLEEVVCDALNIYAYFALELRDSGGQLYLQPDVRQDGIAAVNFG